LSEVTHTAGAVGVDNGGMATAPPGPRYPRPLQSARFLLTEHRLLERCRRRYGDVFAVNTWPFHPLVVVADPAEIRRIFTGEPAELHAGEGNGVLGPLVGPHSVLMLDEDEHLRRRKLLLPPFHGERMRVYGDVMRDLAHAEVDSWPIGTPFPVLPAMQRLTLRIILRTVFGMDEGARMLELERALIRLMRDAARVMLVPQLQRNLGAWSPQGRFERTRAGVDRMLFAQIAARREHGGEGEDVLSLLLAARDEDGRPPSDAELRDHLVTLLVAGHETTATTLGWTFERLVRHPEALARASAEARAGEGHAYLDAVVQESQRVRPVIGYAMRTLKAPMRVGGYDVPAGATLGSSITLVHRRPDLYPDPHAFRPERFEGRKPETYSWIPFGGGVRRCLGAAFAAFEMRQVLGATLARCELRPADTRPEPRKRKAITHFPGRGATVVLERREPRAAPAAAPEAVAVA
jgi:cytochrome P450 family 135